MPPIPKWAKAKMKRTKPRRWGKNPQGVNTAQPRMLTMSYKDEHGATVLYRDHNRSMGSIKQDANFGDDLVTKHHKITYETSYQGLPLKLVNFLKRFESVDDENLPPIIVNMRRRKESWQGTKVQGKTHRVCIPVYDGDSVQLICFLMSGKGSFVYINHIAGWIRESAIYPSDVIKDMLELNLDHIIYSTHWISRVSIPQPGP